MQYRREIDGLRAVAVLPVIFFHAGFSVFSGGFVGVDVFFVISGYLITSILIAELEQGKFSIARFYERRARRILPALFVVMLACLPFAYMWMLPPQLKDFAQSLVSVVFFASNILFWRESGYFAAAAELKPLLHTWSLAVEEQYYLLFPLFLLLLWRFGRQRVFWAIIFIAVASLLLAEWGWRNSRTANFYLAPTRAWELLAGSICAFLTVGKMQRSSNVLSISGLALIVFAIFAYSDKTPFPSVYTLAPVAGTGLVILFAGENTWVARLLSLRGFVGIGLISYSAYLWHQPLFAFARLRSVTETSQVLMGVLAIAALLLAWATWRYVEQPFRKRANQVLVTRRSVFVMSGVVGAVFVAVGLAGQMQNGNIFQKFDPRNIRLLEQMHAGNITWKNKNTLRMRDFERNGKTNILVIGDSNSGDLLNSLIYALGNSANFSSITIEVGCGNIFIERSRFEDDPSAKAEAKCRNSDVYDQRTLQLISDANYVFLASSWREFEAKLFGESWARLNEKFGPKFYVFGAKDISFTEREILTTDFEVLPKVRFRQSKDKLEINRILEQVAGDAFINPYDVFCVGEICPIFENYTPLYYDGSHITEHGVAKLSEWLMNWMRQRGMLGDVGVKETAGKAYCTAETFAGMAACAE